MCGIVGLYRWPDSTSESVSARLTAMCEAIAHRGPDDIGTLVDGPVGLGMRRLSIIDVNGGRQPISNEDGRVTVVFNGEIYNYRELRRDLDAKGHRFRTKSDTEVIVHGYEEEGTACAKRFNGIFAYALWDAASRRLVLTRDRIGVKPLYYTQWRGGLAFASEIKALLTLPELPRTLDLEAAGQFFRLGYVVAPRTLFREIRKLPPGWSLIAEGEQVRFEQYWDLTFATEENRDFPSYCEELRALLEETVVGQMVSDVPVGAFLSGGVDSSAITALMRQAANQGVRTYSIGFDRQYAYHNEAPYAEAVAKQLGTQHETLIVQPRVAELMPRLVEQLDEPLTDTSFLVTYLVSELAHRDVKVVLSGVGGDELFGGYRRYLAPTLRRAVSWMPESLRKMIGGQMGRLRDDRGTVWGNLNRYAKMLGRSLHLPLGEQYLNLVAVMSQDGVNNLLAAHHAMPDPGNELVEIFNQVNAPTALDRLLYVDLKTVLPESLLLLTDKMGMASSLEIRVPFLDNKLVDFVSRIPSRYRLRGMTLKRLLKQAVKGVVPDFVLTRSKRGFGTPMGSWLRKDLQPMVQEILEDSELRREGLFNPAMVRDMLAVHQRGHGDFTEPIFALLAFELWRRCYRITIP